MPDHVRETSRAFSFALQNISSEWTARQRVSRQLLLDDPLERIVPETLLCERVGQFLETRQPKKQPLVIFLDFCGGGPGAQAAIRLMPLITQRLSGVSYIHVAFNTPSRGSGLLIRSLLQSAGAKHSIDVHVVSHNRPAQGLKASQAEIDEMLKNASLVIAYGPGGYGGFICQQGDAAVHSLLARSHVGVLSLPDPDALVAELPNLEERLGGEPGLDAIRIWVQVKTDKGFEDLGTVVLGRGGDAKDRLWVLIDNARRRPYRALVEPMAVGVSNGDPLIWPCRTVVENDLLGSATVVRTVPAGSRLVMVTQGRKTLT
jgi:hypothetical protein